MPVTNTFTDTISTTYTGNGKSVSSKVGSYNGTRDAGCATVITAGVVNQEIDVAFTFADIQSIIIDGDQNLTIKTNSTSSPGQTINLPATSAIVWAHDYAGANPITADVTKLFVSNPGATDAKFNVRVLLS